MYPSLDEQNVVAKKVIAAHQARQKALALFSEATLAVEMAIEQDEAAALSWTNSQASNLGVSHE